MLRLLMIVSGSVEAAFGISALILPQAVISVLLGGEGDAKSVALARVVGAATLALGAAALLARDQLASQGGLAAAYGLTLYNVLAGVVILWVAAAGSLGGLALWGAGLYHALMGVLLVYALAMERRR